MWPHNRTLQLDGGLSHTIDFLFQEKVTYIENRQIATELFWFKPNLLYHIGCIKVYPRRKIFKVEPLKLAIIDECRNLRKPSIDCERVAPTLYLKSMNIRFNITKQTTAATEVIKTRKRSLLSQTKVLLVNYGWLQSLSRCVCVRACVRACVCVCARARAYVYGPHNVLN